jgi:hypothetical protein
MFQHVMMACPLRRFALTRAKCVTYFGVLLYARDPLWFPIRVFFFFLARVAVIFLSDD